MDSWFSFSVAPVELLIRGTLMYWLVLLIVRFVLRRGGSSAGLPDLLFVVLLGDAAQNGMIGQGHTVADAAALVLVLTAWNYVLDVGGYYVPAIAHLTDPPPLILVRNGRVVTRNLRREHITRTELAEAMREHGIEKLEQVKFLRLEPNGEFSVIKHHA